MFLFCIAHSRQHTEFKPTLVKNPLNPGGLHFAMLRYFAFIYCLKMLSLRFVYLPASMTISHAYTTSYIQCNNFVKYVKYLLLK